LQVWEYQKDLQRNKLNLQNLIVTEEGRKTDSECAIEAGYDPNSAYVSASKLQNPSCILWYSIHWKT